MKNIDLESKIRSLRVPQRDDGYWEQFPDRVLAELRAAPAERPARTLYAEGFFWSVRVALAGVMMVFCLWQSHAPRVLSHELRKDEKELRQSVERFHHNLGRLMQDEHGLHRLIEDQS